MTAFIASYKGELTKLLSRKKYMVFLIIGVVICVIWAVLGLTIINLIGDFRNILLGFLPTPMGALPFFLQVMIPLLIFMGATDLFTTEASEHTMKAMLYRPVERWKLYASKQAAILTYAVVYLLCIFAISTILNQIVGRPLGIMELFRSFAAYMLTILPLGVLTSFAALVAILGKSSTLTMFVLVVAYVVMNILPILFPVFTELLFTSFLGWHRLWIGMLPPASRLIQMFTIVASYGVVFFMGGSLLFDKKEY